MTEDEIVAAGVVGLSKALAKGRATARAATRAYLDRIARLDPYLKAFITVSADAAMKAARASDARRARGRTLGPLDGVPVAIKDNIAVAGIATTAGIGGRREALAERDAYVVARLRAAGSVVLGTLNMHEGALGATTDNAAYGRCMNPHREGFTPGGSSGGSGAAVAAGLCAAALGTDTLGSIRIPASYCGVAGFKPTYGLLSNGGAVPCAGSLDHIGPLARSAADCAAVMRVLAGFDPDCPESRPSPSTRRTPKVDLKSMRIGVVMDLAARAEGPTQDAFVAALARLKRAGWRFREAKLGLDVTRLRVDGFAVAGAESWAFHKADLERAPEGFTEIYRKLMSFGATQSGADLAARYASLAEAIPRARSLFSEFDALVLPTTPTPAFAHGSRTPVTQADLTCFANPARLPAASVPMGSSTVCPSACRSGAPSSTTPASSRSRRRRRRRWVCPRPLLAGPDPAIHSPLHRTLGRPDQARP